MLPVELVLQLHNVCITKWQVQYTESGSSTFETFASEFDSLEGVTITGLTPGMAYQVSLTLLLPNTNDSLNLMHHGLLATRLQLLLRQPHESGSPTSN